jgi:hypothetical protein
MISAQTLRVCRVKNGFAPPIGSDMFFRIMLWDRAPGKVSSLPLSRRSVSRPEAPSIN